MDRLSRSAVTVQLSELGVELLSDCPRHAERLAEHIRAAIPLYYSGHAVTWDDLLASCAAQLGIVFSALVGKPSSAEYRVGEYGQRQAAAGVPLATLLEACHVAIGFVWRTISVAAVEHGLSANAQARALAEVWRAHDTFVRESVDSFKGEVSSQLAADYELHAATVRLLFVGASLDRVKLWTAADLLGLPYEGPYVVVAATSHGGGKPALPMIGSRLKVVGIHSAWTDDLDGLAVGVVRLVKPESQLDWLAETLEQVSTAPVGVSPVYRSLLDSADALRLARIALDGSLGGKRVLLFDRELLAVATAGSPFVAAQLAAVVLAPLDGIPMKERRLLLDTFGSWLDSGGSTNKTAERMLCHPNTVRYRLRRLEERTGRSLTNPREVAELSLAYEADRRQPDPQPPAA